MSNAGLRWKDSVETTKIAGGMRRRHPTSSEYNSASEAPKSGADIGLARSIQNFDVYAKVDDDLQVKTETGALVTISFWVLMLLLVGGEVAAYLRRSPPTERVVVDSTMGQKLRINADITFHSIPCLDVHVDAMDVAGENQLDIDHDILKQRLGPDGEAIGDPFAEVPGEGDQKLDVPPDYCGSCYGASSKKCCNTCKDVTDAYTREGWTLHDIRRTAEQCIRDHHIDVPIVDGEGCRLSGFMRVNKVSGNFHIAAGEGVMRDGRHVHQYNLDEAEAFNTSHTIHSLSFGERYPGMRPNPLDGTSKIIDEDVGTGLFQYFIKLVPTIHPVVASSNGANGKASTLNEAIDAMLTSQFAYTFKFRSMKGSTQYHRDREARVPDHHTAHGEDQGATGSESESESESTIFNILPGVFFVYDVSPFMVEVTPATTLPFSHFLTRLCAVAGGAFAVSGIVDSVVHYLATPRRLQGLLGR